MSDNKEIGSQIVKISDLKKGLEISLDHPQRFEAVSSLTIVSFATDGAEIEMIKHK